MRYDNNILRKWRYIAYRFELLGKQKLADMAWKLDDDVVKDCGSVHTSEWAEACNMGKVGWMSVKTLVRSASFCTPCTVSHRQCGNCAFAKTGKNRYKALVHEMWMES